MAGSNSKPKRYRPQVAYDKKKRREHYLKYGNDYYNKNRDRINEKRRKRYAIAGKSTKQAQRESLSKATHKQNRELLAARPRPNTCDVCHEAGRIVFDHCHKTQHFRGWICDVCNRTLGAAKDDINRLLMLVAYLRRTEGGQGAQSSLPGI